jgi:hypothetical protein
MIVHNKKIGKRLWKKCYAYTIEEAKERGLEWKDLRDEEISEYVKTDDDYIVKLILKKRYNKDLWIKTEFGSIFGRQKLLVNKELIPYGDWKAKKLTKKKRFPIVVDYIVACILTNSTINPDVIGNILGLKYRNTNLIWKNLMNQPEVRQMVQKSLVERLSDLNVDEGKVVNLIDDAIVIAKKKGNAFAILKAAELLGKYLGMDAKTVIRETHSTDSEGNISKILKEISIEG